MKVFIRSFLPPSGVGIYAFANLITTITSGVILTSTIMYFSLVGKVESSSIAVAMTAGAALGVICMPFIGRFAAKYSPKDTYISLLILQSVMISMWQMVKWTEIALLILVATTIVDRSINAVTGGFIASLRIEKESWPRARAYLRSITNIGIGIGGLIAGAFLILENQNNLRILITFAAIGPLISALLIRKIPVVTVPRRKVAVCEKNNLPTQPPLKEKFKYIYLSLGNGILGISTDIFSIAVPLIILRSSLSNGLVGVATALNTIVVVMLQVYISERTTKNNWPIVAYCAAGFLASGLWLLYLTSIVSGKYAVIFLTIAIFMVTFSEIMQSSVSFLLSYSCTPDGNHSEYQANYATGRATIRACAPAALSNLVHAGLPGWAFATIVVAAAAIVQHRSAMSLLSK